jgi:hypothetical protein
VRGCLFTLVLAAAVLGGIVLFGLPALAEGVLTVAIGAAGLQADDTRVTVTADPPTELLELRADRVRVTATGAMFRGLAIASFDVRFSDVALLERTAAGVDGTLTGVEVPIDGGAPVLLPSLALSGGGEDITVTTTLGGPEAEALIADAVEAEIGSRPSAITISAPDRLVVRIGVVSHATLAVTGTGDLIARVTDGPAAGRTVVLLRGGEDLPVRLTSVRVTTAGDLRLAGSLDVGLLQGLLP